MFDVAHVRTYIGQSVGLPGNWSFKFCKKINKPIVPLKSMHIYRMAKSIHEQDLCAGKRVFRIDNMACPIHLLRGVIIACF